LLCDAAAAVGNDEILQESLRSVQMNTTCARLYTLLVHVITGNVVAYQPQMCTVTDLIETFQLR